MPMLGGIHHAVLKELCFKFNNIYIKDVIKMEEKTFTTTKISLEEALKLFQNGYEYIVITDNKTKTARYILTIPKIMKILTFLCKYKSYDSALATKVGNCRDLENLLSQQISNYSFYTTDTLLTALRKIKQWGILGYYLCYDASEPVGVVDLDKMLPVLIRELNSFKIRTAKLIYEYIFAKTIFQFPVYAPNTQLKRIISDMDKWYYKVVVIHRRAKPLGVLTYQDILNYFLERKIAENVKKYGINYFLTTTVASLIRRNGFPLVNIEELTEDTVASFLLNKKFFVVTKDNIFRGLVDGRVLVEIILNYV